MGIEILKPSAFTGTFVNPEFAYDGVGVDDNGTYASQTVKGSDIGDWHGVPASQEVKTLSQRLYFTYEFIGAATSDQRDVYYSTNGGSSWILWFDATDAAAKTTINIDIPAETDPQLVQVRVEKVKSGGGQSGLESKIWNIYVEVTGEDVPNRVLNTTRSRDASLNYDTVENIVTTAERNRTTSMVYSHVTQILLDGQKQRNTSASLHEIFPVSYSCAAPMKCDVSFECYNTGETEPTSFKFIPLYMSAF